MNESRNDWLEIRLKRQPERTALAAKLRCTPDSSEAEWERLQRALAAFDDETERIYEQTMMERFHRPWMSGHSDDARDSQRSDVDPALALDR